MEKQVMKAAEQPMVVPKDYVDLLLVQKMTDDKLVAATVPFGEAKVEDIVNVDGELGLVVDMIPLLETDSDVIRFESQFHPVVRVYAVYSLKWSKGGEADA